MKKDIKKLAGSQVELLVSLADNEFSSYYQTAYDQAASEVTLKGFRKGTAPKEMVDSVLNHDAIFREAINRAVRWSLDEVKEEEKWTFIDQPKIEVTEGEPGKGISYKATLTVFPEVKLGNYKKIAAKIFGEKSEIVVSEEDITKTIEWIRGSRSKETRVARGAKPGDLVEIDVDTESGGVPVAGASFKSDRFIVGESNFITGFDKQLEGKKENEVAKFSITAPQDYWQKDVRGKQLDFTVTVRGVFERELPALTDEFAASLGSKFKTVADLNQSVREGIALERKEKEAEKRRMKALEEIGKDSKMDIPPVLIERTLDSLVADVARMVPPQDNKNPQELVKELREKMRERAVSNVRSNLVLYKIAQIENITPTAQEVEAEAARRGVDVEQEHDYIYGTLQNQKVYALLEAQATN